jgi:hypothetical protein
VVFLQGGFAIPGVQNVVNWVVQRGGVMVKVWLEMTANHFAENSHIFCIFFELFCNVGRTALTIALVSIKSPGDYSVLPAIQWVMRRVSRMMQSENNSMVMRYLPAAA